MAYCILLKILNKELNIKKSQKSQKSKCFCDLMCLMHSAVKRPALHTKKYNRLYLHRHGNGLPKQVMSYLDRNLIEVGIPANVLFNGKLMDHFILTIIYHNSCK